MGNATQTIMVVAAVAVMIVAPEVAPLIGEALGASGAMATAVGNAAIGATAGAIGGSTTGGDAVWRGALTNAVGSVAGGAMSGAVGGVGQAVSEGVGGGAIGGIASGVTRGAIGGAASGLVGGGLQAGLTGKSVGETALTGAEKGAVGGAITGGLGAAGREFGSYLGSQFGDQTTTSEYGPVKPDSISGGERVGGMLGNIAGQYGSQYAKSELFPQQTTSYSSGGGTATGATDSGAGQPLAPQISAGSSALAQALRTTPGVVGGGGVEPSSGEGQQENVWNVSSLKLKDALGA